MESEMIIDHIFKFRIEPTDEKGGCTFIGGEWRRRINKRFI